MQSPEVKTAAVKTWKPVAGGILAIISGSFDLLGGFGCIIGSIVIGNASNWPGLFEQGSNPDLGPFGVKLVAGVLIAVAVYLFIAGSLALLGGIHAIQRKKWALALTGSIFAIFGSTVLGILALIFISTSKQEFD